MSRVKFACPEHPEVDSDIHWGCPDCLYAQRQTIKELVEALEAFVGELAEDDPEFWRVMEEEADSEAVITGAFPAQLWLDARAALAKARGRRDG